MANAPNDRLLNPYLDAFMRLTNGSTGGIEALVTQYYAHRRQMVLIYAWAVPMPYVIHRIAEAFDAVVEIGAGTGYWAWQLRQAGVAVYAYDEHPYANAQANHYWSEIARGGPECATQHPDAALLLCWPPYDNPMARDALRAYKGNHLIYVGEPEGGCTGDDAFHRKLRYGWTLTQEYEIPQWDGIHDRVFFYERRRRAKYS